MRLHAKLLFAIVPVIVVSLLSLGWVVYAQLRNHSEQVLLNQMDTFLTQTVQQTESFVETVEANARLFANSNLIKRYVLIEDEAERYDLFQPALLRIFSSYQQAYPQYREIRLLTPNGYEDTRLTTVQLPNLTEEEGTMPFFKALENNRGPSYLHISTNEDDGEVTLSIGRPIWLADRNVAPSAAESKLRGYLTITTDMDSVSNNIQRQTIGEAGYLMVIDQQGKILFHKNPRLAGGTIFSLLFDLQKIPQGQTAKGIEIRDTKNTVQWRALSDDLMVVAVVPESEFATSSYHLARTVATITILVILLTTTCFYLLLRSMVLLPITRLRETAIAIGDGRANIPIDSDREDEIGDLARALSDMNQKLGLSMNELQHSHAKIEQLAYRDTLTNLPNRRLFIRYVEQAMKSEQLKNGKLAILFLDLDDFKRVNDTLGHEAGDILLREVSNRLLHCIRESDELALMQRSSDATRNQVARIGGDEFIILLSALGHPDHATIVAKRIISELARTVTIDERSFVIGTSIGISMYPHDASDVDGLIKCADTAMYEAKRTEKNTYRYFGATMQASIETRLRLEEDLRFASKRNQFELYFQPQFDTRTGNLAGTEVLLRWNHPERGMVPPDLFIPVAEETGMIGELGEWVLMQACWQWQQWHAKGIAPVRIAVNVSQRQFALRDLTQAVQHALCQYEMDPKSLELELTESCMMEAPAEVVDTLRTLRQLGVRIAMDDFGTGYSSLGALTSLPIDTLKIDRSFVSGIKEDSQNSKVVSAILMLARSLDLEIVAEGVEVQAELDYLAKRDCDIVQGYLLGRPLSAAGMTEVLMTLKNRDLKKAS